MFITCCVPFGVLLYLLVRKVLCTQFVTLTWILDVFQNFGFILTWLQRRIAVAFLIVLDVVKAAPQARPKTT